jgi:signal peptidase II
MADTPDDGGGDLQDAAARSNPLGAVPGRAERRRPHRVVYVGLVAAIVAVDQLTKAWIVANVRPGSPVRVVDDLLRLIYSQNTGALFGLFRDNATLFAIVSIGVIAAIVWYHGRAGRSLLLSIGLGLLTGGAIGNLADRLIRGHVVDFVDAGIGDVRFYTFNVADAAISTALAILIALSLFPSLAGNAAPDRRKAGGATEPAADG